ncbi:MAG: hypothetical protein ACPGSI_18845, partial [Pikeienuella sp.]
YGEWFVGTELGGIYKLTRTNADVGSPLLRRMVFETLDNAGEYFSVDKVEIRMRTGRSNLGRDAQAMFRWSRDRGETWGVEKWRSIGSQGQYGKRVTLRAQGAFKDATLEMTISDPAEIPVDDMGYIFLS